MDEAQKLWKASYLTWKLEYSSDHLWILTTHLLSHLLLGNFNIPSWFTHSFSHRFNHVWNAWRMRFFPKILYTLENSKLALCIIKINNQWIHWRLLKNSDSQALPMSSVPENFRLKYAYGKNWFSKIFEFKKLYFCILTI